jgi:CRISPR/Cas system endoribonuclease Cas6 (RAMP superfamily)
VFSGAVVQSVVLALLNEPRLHDVRPKPFTVWPLVVNGRVVWNRALAPAGAAVELRVAFFDGGLAEVFMERVMETGRFRWRCGVSHLRQVLRLSSRWSSSRLRVSRRRRM